MKTFRNLSFFVLLLLSAFTVQTLYSGSATGKKKSDQQEVLTIRGKVIDSETGERILIDTGSLQVRKEFEGFGVEQKTRLRELFRSMDVDLAEIVTGKDYVKDLVGFFRRRERRAQYG